MRVLRAPDRRSVTARLAAMAMLCLALASGSARAQGMAGGGFDHLKTGYPLTGLHVQARCESCHLNGTFNGTPRDCASCHVTGNRFARSNAVRPQNHFPTTQGCDSCHATQSFIGARFTHQGVGPGTCMRCHNGMSAGSKPSNHVPTSASCDSCHRTTTWLGASSTDHSLFNAATNCALCHGVSTIGKPANHIPVSANCIICHNVSPGRFRPSKWNHTQVVVTSACAGCHSGAFPPADGRPANHIPYAMVAAAAAANCDTCHRGGFATWASGRLHGSVTVSTGCVTCHTLMAGGSFLAAVGKPTTATHAGVTGNCESCHKSTASWTSGVAFAHSAANAVGTGTCDTCHNGSTAKGRPATHIPLTAATARCDGCHRSQASFAVALTMNHTVVATQVCKGCHNGSFASQGTQGALAKPTNHIPEVQLLGGATLDCNACHAGTAAWMSVTTNHNNSQGNGAGSCKACHATGTAYLGNMQRMSLTHRSATATDCSQSGCHRPLGTRGTPYRSWD
jgi:Cytochrome c7 and related cytochrome c